MGGGGQDLWPRPGRILAAARSHTFAQLATAIDDAFARWDRAHLHQFDLTDGARIGRPDWDDEAENLLDGRRTTLARLKNDEQFVYEFDFGDSAVDLGEAGAAGFVQRCTAHLFEQLFDHRPDAHDLGRLFDLVGGVDGRVVLAGLLGHPHAVLGDHDDTLRLALGGGACCSSGVGFNSPYPAPSQPLGECSL